MKKPVIYASSMYEDIFQSSVLCLISNDKKYLYDEMPNVLSEDFGILKEDIGYFTKELRKCFDEGGRCFTFGNNYRYRCS